MTIDSKLPVSPQTPDRIAERARLYSCRVNNESDERFPGLRGPTNFPQMMLESEREFRRGQIIDTIMGDIPLRDPKSSCEL